MTPIMPPGVIRQWRPLTPAVLGSLRRECVAPFGVDSVPLLRQMASSSLHLPLLGVRPSSAVWPGRAREKPVRSLDCPFELDVAHDVQSSSCAGKEQSFSKEYISTPSRMRSGGGRSIKRASCRTRPTRPVGRGPPPPSRSSHEPPRGVAADETRRAELPARCRGWDLDTEGQRARSRAAIFPRKPRAAGFDTETSGG